VALEYGVPIRPNRKIRNSFEAILQSYRSGRIKRVFESPEFTVRSPSAWELIYESRRGRIRIGTGIRKTGPRWYESIAVVEIPDGLCWDGDREQKIREDELQTILEQISQALTFFLVDHEFRKTAAGRWLEP
jgi:hypothetical protein